MPLALGGRLAENGGAEVVPRLFGGAATRQYEHPILDLRIVPSTTGRSGLRVLSNPEMSLKRRHVSRG